MEAILVIDVDSQDGWKDRINSQITIQRTNVARKIRQQINAARRRNGLICFVTVVSPSEFKRFWRPVQIPEKKKIGEGRYCIVCEGDEKNHIVKFLEHRHENPNEPAFIKYECEPDAFSNPFIASYLRLRRVTSIRLLGCMTNICVFHSALGALREGFRVVLLSDCIYHPFANDDEEIEWLERLRSQVPEEMREKIPSKITREASDGLLLRVVRTR